jgi:hypothetical protein
MRVLLGATASAYKNGETIGDILAYNHAGTETIPPRPVLLIAAKNTIAKNKKEIEAYLDNLVEYSKKRPQDIPRIESELLRKLGSQSVAEAKRIILSGDQLQENAPATLARKKGTKPLYVDGTMMKHLAYQIDSEDE